jgi:hypothetical protein
MTIDELIEQEFNKHKLLPFTPEQGFIASMLRAYRLGLAEGAEGVCDRMRAAGEGSALRRMIEKSKP